MNQANMDALIAYVKKNFGEAPNPGSPLCRQFFDQNKCAAFVPPNVALPQAL
jgi:hypothetical protein